MFKKIVKVISVAAVLAVSASAMDFCKTADNLFLKNGLDKAFLKYNNKPKLGAACERSIGSPVCQGEMEAYKKLADALFNSSGFDRAITLLNKYGVKQQYNKTQMYINYNNFFVDYLKNKLKEMPESKRKLFLEKLYFFFNRVPDQFINLNSEKLAEMEFNLAILKIFKGLIIGINNKDKDAIKEVMKLGADTYLANTRFKGQNTIKGQVSLAFHPLLNLKYKILNKNMQGYSSKDPRLGGSADNLEKFFVYAATKQYNKAFNLIDKTYPDSFVKDFNSYIRDVCSIKK